MSNLTNEQIQEIRELLKNFLKENPKISQGTVGKNIGYSSTTISQFLNGNYPTESTLPEIAAKIHTYMKTFQTSADSTGSKGTLKFAMTTAAESIFKIAHYSQLARTIGVVTGVPGCGKTIACKEYKKRNPTAILIEVTPLVTQKSLLKDLAEELKIPTTYFRRDLEFSQPRDILFRSIITKLQDTNRILIIDEGENLTVPCLEIIRRIQDFTKIGMLICGTSKLLDRLRGQRKELQQLFSRVGYQREITTLEFQDVKAILLINYPDAIKFTQTFLSLSKHNGRYLQHLISIVRKSIEDNKLELCDELIDDAASSLMT